MLLQSCAPGPSPTRLAGGTMGTTWEVLVPRLPRGVSRDQVQGAVDTVLDEVNRHLSGWDATSELARFNAAEVTEWIPASATLVEVVVQSQAVSRASGGAFDVTVGPLVRAWGFGAGAAEGAATPAPFEIERLRASVGYEKLALQQRPPALRKATPALRVDLDGIAPGVAVDRIAARLEALGIRDYLVELGGEVRARGRNTSGRSWRIAVEAPVPGERRAHAVVELDGVGVSTSGDYRDFRESDGRRISHTIDPRTGAPVAHGLASVTVVHESVTVADAWSTALMVLGPEEGLALAQRQGLAALFIERGPDGALIEFATPAFARFRRPLGRAL